MVSLKIEDWLRLCVERNSEDGMVTLPCDHVLGIAEYIERHRGTDEERTCKTCAHFLDDWDSEPCDVCTSGQSNWERKNDE